MSSYIKEEQIVRINTFLNIQHHQSEPKRSSLAGKEIKATGNLDGLTEEFGLKGSFSFTGASNFFLSLSIFFSLGNQPGKGKKNPPPSCRQ